MTPSTTPVPGEASDVERTMSGETVAGYRVAAWRYHRHDETDKLPHAYCEHWSTPGNGAHSIERLFTETQLRQALAAAPQPAQGTARCRSCGSTRTREELDAGGWINCCPERSMNEVIERDHGVPALVVQGIEAEELARELENALQEQHFEVEGDDIDGRVWLEGYFDLSAVAASILSRLTPIIAGEGEAKPTLGEIGDAFKAGFLAHRDGKNMGVSENDYVIARIRAVRATQSPDLAGKGGAG